MSAYPIAVSHKASTDFTTELNFFISFIKHERILLGGILLQMKPALLDTDQSV